MDSQHETCEKNGTLTRESLCSVDEGDAKEVRIETCDAADEGKPNAIPVDSAEALFDRELSWLAFAHRVLAVAEDPDLPLLERVKFAGIMGMLHDEFFTKRMSGIKRRIRRGSAKRSPDGHSAEEQLNACRREIIGQMDELATVIREEIRPQLADEGLPIIDYDQLDPEYQEYLRDYFQHSVQPILTPLAVDAAHPFPFISSHALNLAVEVPDGDTGKQRFVRIKVPDNRPRWSALPFESGFVPLEQVIANNLDLMFPSTPPSAVYFFRVTRGAEGEKDPGEDLTPEEPLVEPGSIIRQVSNELKERRFAGVVRLQVDREMPARMVAWIGKQLMIDDEDVYRTDTFLAVSDLLQLDAPGHKDLRLQRHKPATHPRLRSLSSDEPAEIFPEISGGDILLHHPYHSFDNSVLRFLESAAVDPAVLAIKLTIYRTSKDSPIVQALAEAARQGKQVAVLVEITASFDEAPNMAWGKFLEREGVHVAYGVEKLKTHVKLILVVREEGGQVRRYAHVGTGNYHTGTARIYEDLGILTSHPEICEDVATVFNDLTGATRPHSYKRILVAPYIMRNRFVELIRREAENARQGRISGIDAKMNQLQDPEMIQELYRASQAGVPVRLIVRGLCCLRPGVPGLSESISVLSVVDRFLEHSRIFRFVNGGDHDYFIGSADWMKRNLNGRVETIIPVLDRNIQAELAEILEVYFQDNCSVWEGQPDGTYVRRTPTDGQDRQATQEIFIRRAAKSAPGKGKREKYDRHAPEMAPVPGDVF